jgi:hypothetical protein
MIARLRGAILLLSAVGISACVPLEHPAERALISTEITFVTPDHHPLANEMGYILEPLPFTEEITETFRTDKDGKVRLDGTYCTPLVVAVDGGGGAVLRADGVASSHVVVVNADRQPTKEAAYGQPNTDYKTLRRAPSYKDCGQ